jgi:hypothetical protein
VISVAHEVERLNGKYVIAYKEWLEAHHAAENDGRTGCLAFMFVLLVVAATYGVIRFEGFYKAKVADIEQRLEALEATK